MRSVVVIALVVGCVWAQADEQAIRQQIRGLRSLADDKRAVVTRQLALDIRKLPAAKQLQLATSLAVVSTEGDFGRDTLQAVTTTLEGALRAMPPAMHDGKPDSAYLSLAQLARYEHMRVRLDQPQYAAAMKMLEEDDAVRGKATFSLKDLNGKQWRLSNLRGKVVLVNFWATWCPPCRKEIPDLQGLYGRFQSKGLVILGITDEPREKVMPFLAKYPMDYPVLLDPEGSTGKAFRVDSLPKNLVYDREGRLAAQSIDMRTMSQFLGMLKAAGLE